MADVAVEDRPEDPGDMDGGAASRKRGAPPTSDGSGRKRARKCEHGREKTACKECGGSGICPHGREKRRCKECGGSGICLHGRIKSQCKECGGSAICPHGKRKSQCKDCRPSKLHRLAN
jgi:hypothetical protein